MKILVIDIETTGFFGTGAKIVEIGIVQLDLSNGNTKGLFNNVVHEGKMPKEHYENSWILKNSSLTIEDISKAKNLNNYKEEIQSIIYEHPHGITAYNKKFDFLEDRGFHFPRKLDCPMLLGENILKIPKRGKKTSGSYKWPSVEESYRTYFNKPDYKEEHRAICDALDEAKIVMHLYKMGVFKIPELPNGFVDHAGFLKKNKYGVLLFAKGKHKGDSPVTEGNYTLWLIRDVTEISPETKYWLKKLVLDK